MKDIIITVLGNEDLRNPVSSIDQINSINQFNIESRKMFEADIIIYSDGEHNITFKSRFTEGITATEMANRVAAYQPQIDSKNDN